MLSDLHMFTLSQHSAPPLDGGRLPAQRGQQANSHQKLQARAPVKACDPRKKKKSKPSAMTALSLVPFSPDMPGFLAAAHQFGSDAAWPWSEAPSAWMWFILICCHGSVMGLLLLVD